jgi:soluble lytic murein transglycosylase
MLLLTVLLLPLVGLGGTPLEYILLKKYLSTRDVYTALFILDRFRDAVFLDELRVELALDLLRRGEREKALEVARGIDLSRVRDSYAPKVFEVWTSLGLEPKPLVVRFPERSGDLLERVSLSPEEREEVLKRLLTKGKFGKVLKISGDLCFYRTLALYRLGRYRESAKEGEKCGDRRAWRFALLSYLKTSGLEGAKRFALRKNDPDLYFLMGWEFLTAGDLKNARRYIARSRESVDKYFYLAVIRYMEGRYRIAYELLSEAERLAKGSIERARVLFWKFKVLTAMGDKVMAYHYLNRSAEEEGFYGAVARKLLGEKVFRRPTLKVSGSGDTSLLARLTGIAEAGFPYYLRLEVIREEERITPWDLLALSRLDPHIAIRIAARRFGVGSDLYRSLAFPTPYRQAVRRASGRFGVDEALIYAVMRQESLFDPFAVSVSDAKGLMQLIDSTARWMGKRIGLEPGDLFDPETNITLGTAYLRYLMDLWNGDILRVLASYNAGPEAVRRWKRFEDDFLYIELIPYRETRKYVRRVLWYYYVYRELISEGGT